MAVTHTLPDGCLMRGPHSAQVALSTPGGDTGWGQLKKAGKVTAMARPGDSVIADGEQWIVIDTPCSVINLQSVDADPVKFVKCEKCKGTGEVKAPCTCPVCNGKKFCPSCNGSGRRKEWNDAETG